MSYDYEKLGLKSGLEIHQQLDSATKLFSRAPNYLRSDAPDYVVKRKLHRVAGEEGEVDVAVEYEASIAKNFSYECYDDSVSLVELDEEPPREISGEALDICLQIALLLNCEIYPVSQVMRKTVIDGSNTSGFQRTVLIGHSGYVETSFGKVPIESVALEEDSARRVKKEGKSITWRLDRLGIPLIEIATKPTMKNPEQIKETALKIGEILRACKVKRGIGTIRQDVNVSIKGHERVEIKGFQDPKMMIKTVDLEIDRQLKDLKNKENVGGVRNALPSGATEFLRPLPGRARMYPETDLELLKISRERLDRLRRNLPRLRGDIRDELKKKGLSEELINLILSDKIYLDEFQVLIGVYSKDANLVAKMIALWRPELGKKFGKTVEEIRNILGEGVLEKILEKVSESELDKIYIKEVMEKIVQGSSVEDAVKVEKIDDHEIEEEVRKIVKEKPGLRPNAYMGLVMAKMKGKVDARKAMEIILRIVG